MKDFFNFKLLVLDMDWTNLLLLMFLTSQLSNHVMVKSVITDVRLVGGPSSNKGTVEYRQDNGTWETSCGTYLHIGDVIVICRQLGFLGASILIRDTPYGQTAGPPTSIGVQCTDDEPDLSHCKFSVPFPFCLWAAVAAASCYSEGYLGCFMDHVTDRALSGSLKQNDSAMTIPKCVRFCNNSTISNYIYAGVNNGMDCYCGEASDDFARHGIRSDADCQIPCSGDPTDSCGGSGYIAVFNIDVDRTTPIIKSTRDTFTTPMSLTTNESNEPSIGMTSDSSTTVPTPTIQQLSNCSCLGVGLGEGMVILFLIGTNVALLVYIIVNRKSQKEVKHNQNSHDMTLVNASSLRENESSFYHDIRDIKPSDVTSQEDPQYSSRIYDRKDGHPCDIKNTNIKWTGKDADP